MAKARGICNLSPFFKVKKGFKGGGERMGRAGGILVDGYDSLSRLMLRLGFKVFILIYIYIQ